MLLQMAESEFSVADGRTIFDNGVARIWQCPNCKWWRQWQDERCSGCGAPRDGGVERNRMAATSQPAPDQNLAVAGEREVE